MVRVIAVALLLTCAARADDLPYLYQRLDKNPVYRSSFEAALRGKPTVPWVERYMRTGDGVDVPGELISIAGKPHELYHVCQPHSCPGNVLWVLYDIGGETAAVLLTVEGAGHRFYGNPTQPQKEALLAADRNIN